MTGWCGTPAPAGEGNHQRFLRVGGHPRRLAAHLAVSARCTSAAGRCVSEAAAGVCVEPGHNSPGTKPPLSADLATAAAGLQVVIIDLDPTVYRTGGAGRQARGHRQAR